MKQILLSATLLFSALLYSQTEVPNHIQNMSLNSETVFIKAAYKAPLSTVGTPYIYEGYQSATIGGRKFSYGVRYNAYADSIEFLQNGQNLTMAKDESYNPIVFTNNSDVLLFKNYTLNNKKISGYLFESATVGDYKIFAKISKKYIKPSYAATSYDKDVNPSYQELPDIYFIQKNNGEIVELPNSKKKLIEMFPDKKTEIDKRFLSNKIAKEDILAIVNLLK